jgi:hypothetical protein
MKKSINLKEIVSLFSLIAIMFIVSGCSHDNCPVDSSMNNESSAKVLSNSDMGGLDISALSSGDKCSDNDADEDDSNESETKKITLEQALPCLKLTTEQMAQVYAFMNAKKNCEKSALFNFKEAIAKIRADQKNMLHALAKKGKTGSVSKSQISAETQKINEYVKTATAAAVAAKKASLKNCYNQLLLNIQSILTTTQLAAWNEWITKGTSPCDYVPPPPGGSIGGQG